MEKMLCLIRPRNYASDYGETSPILLKCKLIKPSMLKHDEYGFVCANAQQFLLETDKTYVSPIQIKKLFLSDIVTSLRWSYVNEIKSR